MIERLLEAKCPTFFTLFYTESGENRDVVFGPQVFSSLESALDTLWGFVRGRIEEDYDGTFENAVAEGGVEVSGALKAAMDPIESLPDAFNGADDADRQAVIEWYFTFSLPYNTYALWRITEHEMPATAPDSTPATQFAIHMEGGSVQDVICTDPAGSQCQFSVFDYDVEGHDDEDCALIRQNNDEQPRTMPALVTHHSVNTYAAIALEDVFSHGRDQS